MNYKISYARNQSGKPGSANIPEWSALMSNNFQATMPWKKILKISRAIAQTKIDAYQSPIKRKDNVISGYSFALPFSNITFKTVLIMKK